MHAYIYIYVYICIYVKHKIARSANASSLFRLLKLSDKLRQRRSASSLMFSMPMMASPW